MQIIFLIALCVLFYARTLRYEYVSDDKTHNDAIKEIPGPWKRALHELTCRGYYVAWESHLWSLLIHASNVILIYLAFGRNDISLLAAALFAINPINNQGAVWVSGRMYALMLQILLLCVLAPIIYVPVLLLVIWKMVIPSVKDKFNNPGMGKNSYRLMSQKIIPGFKTYGYYFRLCVIPYRLGFYHDFMSGLDLSENHDKKCYALNHDFIIGVAAFAGAIFYCVNKMTGYLGLIWFTVLFLPWCNVIKFNMGYADRYAYAGNAGVMYWLASVLAGHPAGFVVFFVFYAVRLWYYLPAYQSEFWFRWYSVIENKRSARPWFNWGVAEWELKDWNYALQFFGEAKLHCPHDWRVNYNYGVMLAAFGELDKAQACFDVCAQNWYENEFKSKQMELLARAFVFMEQAKKGVRVNWGLAGIVK